MNYLVYSTHSGEIMRRVSCESAAIDAQVGPHEGWIEGDADDETHYVAFGAIAARPAITPPAETARMGDAVPLVVPPGSAMTVNGALHVAESADVELVFETDGAFLVEIAPPFPWRPLRVEIEVSP